MEGLIDDLRKKMRGLIGIIKLQNMINVVFLREWYKVNDNYISGFNWGRREGINIVWWTATK